jgi:hypothetical protein
MYKGGIPMSGKVLRVLLIAAVLGMALMLPSTAKAQDGEPIECIEFYIGCLVYPEDGLVFKVPADKPIIMWWGINAYTKGQINEIIKAAQEDYTITGDGFSLHLDPVAAIQYWSEPERVDPVWLWGATTPNGDVYVSDWLYFVGTLDPGKYTVVHRSTLVHPINDGSVNARDPLTGLKIFTPPSLMRAGSSIGTITLIVTKSSS